jgi:hypothetical protein
LQHFLNLHVYNNVRNLQTVLFYSFHNFNSLVMQGLEKFISGAKLEKVVSGIEAVQQGAKFNGTIYVKKENRNTNIVSFYADGSYYQVAVMPEYANEVKEILTDALNGKPSATASAQAQKNEWIVNDTKITNKLDYGQMWALHGTDFE